ncbi:MAG: hypothetical protein ACFCVK_24430 [Acidimicrobiales bacterium]
MNHLVAACGPAVFKGCFLTSAESGASGHDGDPHAELEAALAALSAGVVGIGDRLGRTDPHLVARLCDDLGRLRRPDGPIRLADRSFFAPDDAQVATWAETTAGRHRYILVFHGGPDPEPVADRFPLGDRYLVYDWRAATAEVGDHIPVRLGARHWRLYVCCPLVDVDGVEEAEIGDPTAYVTVTGAAQDQPVRHRRWRRWRHGVGFIDGPPPD